MKELINHPPLKRIFGLILVFVAAASLLFSIYALVRVWQLRQPVTDNIISGIALISDTVKTTADGLDIIKGTLTTASNNVTALQSTTMALGVSTHDASSIVTSFSRLMRTDLPEAISTTQTSFISAQASATVMESVLTAVTQIPFFPGGPYKPDIPLNVALGQAAASMGKLPQALRNISDQLQTASTNLTSVENQIYVFNDSLKQVHKDIANAQKVVDDYQENVAAIQGRLTKLQNHIPGWVRSLVWVLTFGLVWLAIPQMELLWQGLKWMGVLTDPLKPPVN